MNDDSASDPAGTAAAMTIHPAATAAEHQPLLAHVTKRDGAGQMRIRREDGSSVLLRLGPGFAASFSEVGPDNSVREVAVSLSSASCAHQITELRALAGKVTHQTGTQFIRGINRLDTIGFSGGEVARVVEWNLPDGHYARATYSEWRRELSVYFGDTEIDRIITEGRPGVEGWQSNSDKFFMPFNPQGYGAGFAATPAAPGTSHGHVIDTGFGSKRISFHATSGDGSAQLHFSHGAGPAGTLGSGAHQSHDRLEILAIGGHYLGDQYTTDHPNGSITVTSHWESGLNPGGPMAHGSSSFSNHPGTGNITGSGSWAKKGEGGWTTGNWDASVNSDGTSSGAFNSKKPDGTTSRFDWTSNKDGSSVSHTEVHKPDGSGSNSATAKDGKGNESTSTVAYHKDGSFTISTTSKGSDGSTSHQTKEYDKDGKEKPPPPPAPSGGSGGGRPPPDDDGGDDGLPADDGSGGSVPTPKTIGAMTGLAELPSGDGSDPEPRPDTAGPGGGAFQNWLTQGSPFLGGRSNGGSGFRGDPIDRIIGAINDEGDGDGTGRSRSDEPERKVDLRAIILKERDPEVNPKAMFEALALLSGIDPNGAAMAAAERVSTKVTG
ncbi:MAG TPA: hypothetical protein VEA61_16190 [Allosphingosinicella sp.]|nr:hypothetical protein [Allosphingosinicella sp.]